MEFRDYFAGISLLISVITAYWNIFRGSKYVSPPLRWIAFGRMPGSNTLIINFPIAITNIGSYTGVIDSLYIELVNSSTQMSEKFYACQEGELVGQNFKDFSSNMPIPIAIKSGESIVKHYTFAPDSTDFMYVQDTYKLVVYAYLSGKRKPLQLSEQTLEMEDILEPSSLPNLISILYSYNLFPKDVLKVSYYGNHENDAASASMIEVVKR